MTTAKGPSRSNSDPAAAGGAAPTVKRRRASIVGNAPVRAGSLLAVKPKSNTSSSVAAAASSAGISGGGASANPFAGFAFGSAPPGRTPAPLATASAVDVGDECLVSTRTAFSSRAESLGARPNPPKPTAGSKFFESAAPAAGVVSGGPSPTAAAARPTLPTNALSRLKALTSDPEAARSEHEKENIPSVAAPPTRASSDPLNAADAQPTVSLTTIRVPKPTRTELHLASHLRSQKSPLVRSDIRVSLPRRGTIQTEVLFGNTSLLERFKQTADSAAAAAAAGVTTVPPVAAIERDGNAIDSPFIQTERNLRSPPSSVASDSSDSGPSEASDSELAPAPPAPEDVQLLQSGPLRVPFPFAARSVPASPSANPAPLTSVSPLSGDEAADEFDGEPARPRPLSFFDQFRSNITTPAVAAGAMPAPAPKRKSTPSGSRAGGSNKRVRIARTASTVSPFSVAPVRRAGLASAALPPPPGSPQDFSPSLAQSPLPGAVVVPSPALPPPPQRPAPPHPKSPSPPSSDDASPMIQRCETPLAAPVPLRAAAAVLSLAADSDSVSSNETQSAPNLPTHWRPEPPPLAAGGFIRRPFVFSGVSQDSPSPPAPPPLPSPQFSLPRRFGW